MPTVTLHSTGDVVVTASTGTVVGSAPQWGDGSDSTYATSSAGARFFSRVETLTLPAGATVTAVRAEIRAEANQPMQTNLASSTSPGSGFVTYFTSDADPTVFSTLVGTSATTVALIQSTHEIDQDPATVLLAGGWVEAALLGSGTFTVYEFTVFVDYDPGTPTIDPPGRGYPRDDTFGIPGRGWPPPKSVQASGHSAGAFYV